MSKNSLQCQGVSYGLESGTRSILAAVGGGLALTLMAAANCCRAQAVLQQFNSSGAFESRPLSISLLDSREDSADTQSKPANSSDSSAPGEDGTWHVSASPYLWFPGMHGTVGLRGNSESQCKRCRPSFAFPFRSHGCHRTSSQAVGHIRGRHV